MTTTETEVSEPGTDLQPAADVVPELSWERPDPRREARKERFWLPLLLPIGAILVVAFVALNVSRVFLAAAESSSTIAVIIAASITVLVLGGAALISALPNLRTSSLVLTLCGVMVVVMLAGTVVLGPAAGHDEEGGGGFVEPAGEPVNTLEVAALPTLRFDPSEPTAPAGINLIRMTNEGGNHTFVFEDAQYAGFELAVPPATDEKKIELTEGEFVFYCTVPGHRAAGMEGKLTVTAAAAPADGAPPAEGGTQPGASTPTTAG